MFGFLASVAMTCLLCSDGCVCWCLYSQIGDGSNFVIVVGGELLHQAETLVEMGLHPSEIISGYQIAYQHVKQILEDPGM